MHNPWPTLSLKKKPDPSSPKVTTDTESQTPATAAPTTVPSSPPTDQSPSPSQHKENKPAKGLSSKVRKRRRKNAKLRERWYPRLRNGDLSHLAPVLATDLPLQVGIHGELRKRLEPYFQEHEPEALPRLEKIIRACLEHHVRQIPYLEACATQEMRYDLDGRPVEVLQDKGKRYAQRMLRKLAQDTPETKPE